MVLSSRTRPCMCRHLLTYPNVLGELLTTLTAGLHSFTVWFCNLDMGPP